jgi:coenzyme F420 hydrogenase subunit beta
LDGNLVPNGQVKNTGADHEFGPVLEIWEGYAADPEIRHKGSSGGILTALATYCIEAGGMKSVLHTGMDEERPWLNKSCLSKTRMEILSRAGSRYSPASTCEKLASIKKGDTPFVFVGKPCDVAAVTMLCRKDPGLSRGVGLALSLFCAGTPSTQGTLGLLESLGVPANTVDSLHYRGEGWPGEFRVLHGGGTDPRTVPYLLSWGQLSRYRPLRCHLCPDGLGLFADISSGDAWHGFKDNGDPGRSIVVVWTERGREILHRAKDAGYVNLAQIEPSTLLVAQPGLLNRRRQLFGRLLGMALLLLPIPRYNGLSLFKSWARLPVIERARTVVGTLTRVIQRGLWRRGHLPITDGTPRRPISTPLKGAADRFPLFKGGHNDKDDLRNTVPSQRIESRGNNIQPVAGVILPENERHG